MPEVSSYATGQPCWADVTSPDVDAAARFYSDIFGWEAAKAAPEPEAGGYTMFSRNGKYVAAASPPPQEGVPPHWTVGRFAVVADPWGAVFQVIK
jgi:predicted enzyme related to lactoylglutathione lyase